MDENVPPHALDWERYLGNAPKRPYDPLRYFRWRNYNDYGTGVAGDLFVHLLSGVHHVTGSKGPRRIYAQGGVRFWKDGRDAADVVVATMDYGSFDLTLKVNLKSGIPEEQFGVRFSGSNGVLTATYSTLTLEQPADGMGLMSAARAHFRATNDAHRLHHAAFIDSIRNHKPSVEDGTFGLRAAAPALLANRSLATGKVYSWDPETFRFSESA
jgi:predicted dehydrogenase